MQVLDGADRRTVKVAGHLEQAHVPDLAASCAVSGLVAIDLTDLLSADRVAVEALYRLRAEGVELLQLPHYLRFMLDDIGAASNTRPPALGPR
jgi:hypothetical protein